MTRGMPEAVDAARALIDDASVPTRPITCSLYEALISTGTLSGAVELLAGALVDVAPQGELHDEVLVELNHRIVPRLVDPWRLRVRSTLAATETSVPIPDLAVVARTAPGRPTSAALVVEVAVNSQRTDLVHKPAIYAAAGVDQYWVLDVPSREVVVHTSPGPGGYGDVRRVPGGTTRSRGRSTPLSALGIAVDLEALLPPD